MFCFTLFAKDFGSFRTKGLCLASLAKGCSGFNLLKPECFLSLCSRKILVLVPKFRLDEAVVSILPAINNVHLFCLGIEENEKIIIQ